MKKFRCPKWKTCDNYKFTIYKCGHAEKHDHDYTCDIKGELECTKCKPIRKGEK